MVNFLFDPVFQAPILGALLMCLCSSLIGVFLFLRKDSLLGETLSHSTFPGVILALFLFSVLFPSYDSLLFLPVLLGAFLTALLSLYLIEKMQRNLRVKSDAALVFVLALFFAIGIFIASQLQFSHPLLYRKGLVYLYGQLATMTQLHLILYSLFSLFLSLFIFCFYPTLKAVFFDSAYAKSIGMKVAMIEKLFLVLVVFGLVIGMRTVGVILLSGMLVAPAVTARQWTHKLSLILFLSALVGVVSALVGILATHLLFERSGLLLPTGPLIVLTAACFAIVSLLIAPKRGVLFRLVRILSFRIRCIEDNVLKAIWKEGSLSLADLSALRLTSSWRLKILLFHMVTERWLKKEGNRDHYRLTLDGEKRAAEIVRIHRLWELYSSLFLEQGIDRVHATAEELEHIITPEMERELTDLLKNPKLDPHQQPIPDKRR